MRVYVLDDDEVLCQALLRQIRSLGAAPKCANTLEQVLTFEDRPDLMIVDFNLSGTDAIACGAPLERTWPGVPRVVLTAAQLTVEQQEALSHVGFHKVMQKPWLLQQIRDLLEDYRPS